MANQPQPRPADPIRQALKGRVTTALTALVGGPDAAMVAAWVRDKVSMHAEENADRVVERAEALEAKMVMENALRIHEPAVQEARERMINNAEARILNFIRLFDPEGVAMAEEDVRNGWTPGGI